MTEKTPKKSAKIEKKAAAKPAAAKAPQPRNPAAKPPPGKTEPKPPTGKLAEPVLLAGGNPKVAKADGDAPVQAYIAAMPGWKRDVGRSLDAIIAATLPGVRKAVKWNSPFYGAGERGWFLNFHCFTNFVRVAFFKGAALRPLPPGESKMKDVRYLDIREGDEIDKDRLADWVRQASELPGWGG